MKTWILTTFAILFISDTSAAQTHHHDKPSVHGMLVVGKSAIYLSHLPMFHSPHDYQVIVEATFDHHSRSQYLESLKKSDETVYTLAPEPFSLPEMIQGKGKFKAQLFKGHFERNGALITQNVDVAITKVIFFKRFSPHEAKPMESHYTLFGSPSEAFVAHSISAKPDYDHIAEVQITAQVANLLGAKSKANLIFQGFSNTTPVSAHTSHKSLANAGNNPHLIDVILGKNLYLEFGDLSN